MLFGRAEIFPDVLLLTTAGGFAFPDLALAVCFDCALAPARELFLADFVATPTAFLPFAAFRTGAFSAPERLASGFAVAASAFNLRFLAADTPEALPVAGREEGLFALLLTDSLMRSSRYQNDARNRGRETYAA
jgi:hypothetical protein